MDILAWKFIAADHKLRYPHDPRELVAGETLINPLDKDTGSVVTSPVICKSGFHASIQVLDALRYAPGSHIARVEIGGLVDAQHDKICGTECKVLWIADADKALRLFAIDCREDQMTYQLRGREPSLAAIWAIDCARRYVNGEADAEELTASRSAAAAAAAYADYADAYAAAAAADAAADAADAAADAAAADAAADADADAAAADRLTKALEALAPEEI